MTTYIRKEKKSRKEKFQSSLEPQTSLQETQFSEAPPNLDAEDKECPHYVGYLTMLPKGSSFPDECFGCRKVIQCLRIEPTKVIESFYIPTKT